MQKLLNLAARFPVHLRDIMAPRVKWSSRIEGSSFYRIPSVTHFEIVTGKPNEILKDTGLERNLPKETERVVHENNNKMNKYMASRIRLLRDCIKKGKHGLFGKIVHIEMRHSTAFRVSAINTVLKGGYKDQPIDRVYQIVMGVNLILEKEIKKLRYFRVEIPKATNKEIIEFYANDPKAIWKGKMRPLGVPTAPGRVVLHMWNGFLTIFLEEELKRFNHAFMPKVGTNTALKDFALFIPKAAYVYEFDFKGFFNNVHIVSVLQCLAKRGMPYETVKHLLGTLIRGPHNMSHFDDHESEYDLNLTSREGLISGIQRVDTIFEDSYVDELFDNDIFEEKLDEYFGFSISGGKVDQALKGLPQGAAPSTVLSLVILADWYKDLKSKGISLTMYADDGFLFASEEFTPFPPEGLEFSPEKSFGLVKDFVPQKEETKYLGLKYNFKSKLFRGATREGSVLEFGANQLDVLKLILDNSTYGDLMEALVHSGMGGIILSKLYNGKFGELEYESKAIYREDSYGGTHHKIVSLSRDRKAQRLASTVACDGLILQIDKSRSKSKAGLKSEMRKGKSSLRLKIQLQDLRAAVLLDELQNNKDYKIK